MPQVPTVQQPPGGLPRRFPGSPNDLTRAAGTAAQAAVENVLPGASDAAAVLDSQRLGMQIGPALRQGRYADAARAFLDSTTAALGMVPGAAAVGKMGAAAAHALPASLAGVIRAFHGTPHAFEKFDLSKIGTGEGAQAYGHGLYFAENKDVAAAYRQNLSTAENVRVGGKPLTEVVKGHPDVVNTFLSASLRSGNDLAKEAEKLTGLGDLVPEAGEAGRLLKEHVEGKAPIDRGGNLYGVDLDVNHEDLLDWDKPLSQQSPKVQKVLSRKMFADALAKHPKTNPSYLPAGDEPTGGDILEALEQTLGHQRASMRGTSRQQETSKALHGAGIPGIRYLDAGSRGGGEGSRNVVLFDDRLAQIVERNGQPVAPPKPAAERAGDALAALADPNAWRRD